jgi:hypothetical protein
MRNEQFEREERIEPRIERTGATVDGREASLGDLVKQLSSDTATLVQGEVALAKAEMRQIGAMLAKDAAKVGAGAALALAGALALTAFLVIGLGLLIGSFWVAALLVGIAFLGIGGFLAKNAIDDIKRRGIAPEQTAESLKASAAWAKHESREFKRELTK